MNTHDEHRAHSSSCLWAALAISAVSGAIGCATQPPPQPLQQVQLDRAVAPPKRADPPAYLPGPAREALKSRMASHELEMHDLVSAIMVLDYGRIRDCATAIANDTSLTRPLTDDATDLASALPEAFFHFQSELQTRATILVSAAEEQNAFHVADAYGRLSETCVKCHAAYRNGR